LTLFGVMTAFGIALWRHYHLASASRLLGLPQTFLRSLGSGCLEQHSCCCSWFRQLRHFQNCFWDISF